jgi:hypothetical protein
MYAIASKRWHQLRRPSWRLRMMEFRNGKLAEVDLAVLD